MSLLGISVFSYVGCTTTLVPPSAPSHPTAVLIADYGKHSSLLLPNPQGGLVEYAFGDWNYFALGHKSLCVGFTALIHSPQATLGRCWFSINADNPRAASLIGAERTQRVIVAADRVTDLRTHLDEEFSHHVDTQVYNAQEHLYFVHCYESYNLFHNCNTVTAEWLRSLGVQVDGLALFSKFHVESAVVPIH